MKLKYSIISMLLPVWAIAQSPVMQIEGFLDLRHDIDATSIFIGDDVARNVQYDIGTPIARTRWNTIVGNRASRLLRIGWNNLMMGYETCANCDNIDGSVLLGSRVADEQSFGFQNIFIGTNAADSLRFGSKNTLLGYRVGGNLKGGDDNIFIGNQAGPAFDSQIDSLISNNRLYIDVQSSNEPLIYGEFDNDLVRVNGLLSSRSKQPSGQSIGAVIEAADSNRPVLLFSEGGSTFSSGMSIEYNGVGVGANNFLSFNNTPSGNPLMTIKNDGKIGIGTITPLAELEVVGDVIVSSDVEISGNLNLFNLPSGGSMDLRINSSSGIVSQSSSDRRLKEDIATIKEALMKVLLLRGVTFKWKAELEAGDQLGVIAQEVQEVLPELVTQSGKYLGVDYSEMSALFIEAIKEQQEIIVLQEKRINDQQGIVDDLLKRVMVLEQVK